MSYDERTVEGSRKILRGFFQPIFGTYKVNRLYFDGVFIGNITDAWISEFGSWYRHKQFKRWMFLQYFPLFHHKIFVFQCLTEYYQAQDSLESKKAYIPELDSQVAGLREWHPEEKKKGPNKKNWKLDARVA